MRDGLGGKILGEQDQAEIEVSVGIGGIGAKDFAKFLLGEVDLILGDIKVPDIDFCLYGGAIEFERMPEGIGSVRKILFAGADDAQQVVALDAFGVLCELRLNLPLSFFGAALAEERFGYLKSRIGFLRRAGSGLFRR